MENKIFIILLVLKTKCFALSYIDSKLTSRIPVVWTTWSKRVWPNVLFWIVNSSSDSNVVTRTLVAATGILKALFLKVLKVFQTNKDVWGKYSWSAIKSWLLQTSVNVMTCYFEFAFGNRKMRKITFLYEVIFQNYLNAK